jgi:hypothetical protein
MARPCSLNKSLRVEQGVLPEGIVIPTGKWHERYDKVYYGLKNKI